MALPAEHDPTPATSASPAAHLLVEVYGAYRDQFDLVTRRAAARFAHRDWAGGQRDARERLLLYRQFVHWVRDDLATQLGSHYRDGATWALIKERYATLTRDRQDREIARTFFNSVVRRVCGTVGVDPRCEFLGAEYHCGGANHEVIPLRYDASGGIAEALAGILDGSGLSGPWLDRGRDLQLGAAEVERECAARGRPRAFEIVPAVFYRNRAAYLVGRVLTDRGPIPLVIAVVQDPGGGGMVIDAVLLSSDEASVVFGFTRSYFHADTPEPGGVVAFLRSMLPAKGRHELYTALGFNRHGKSELYHLLRTELEQGRALLEPAAGEPGLVMTVFRCPALKVVFKIIRDRFGAPKHTTRRAVREKYHLVFVHDRVGRLADAQEFEALECRREWFAPELLAELRDTAGRTVTVEGDRVVIGHLYTEREVEPLDVFLKRAEPEQARRAIVDYGNAIRDLAAANIFTGDMLLKNFGVTRHGRVIFYDYDELCLLTDCRFRDLPSASHPDDDLAAEPWFHVGDHDVFPETFGPFLVPAGPLGDRFLEAHRELLTLDYWTSMQARQRAGEIVEFFPYSQSRRIGFRGHRGPSPAHRPAEG